MSSDVRHNDTGLGWMMVLSFGLHLVFFISVSGLVSLSRYPLRESRAYYVDIVELPSQNPRPGLPGSAREPVVPLPQSAPVKAVAIPLAPSQVKKKSPDISHRNTPSRDSAADSLSSDEFTKRLKQLRNDSEARRQRAVLDSIRTRVAEKASTRGSSGAPDSSGSQPGSDYAAYIQSRLRDAFSVSIAFQSRKPEVAVKLVIDRKGLLKDAILERSSRDKIFEDAVLRAITMAADSFRPPPDGKDFVQGFIFRPEGVGKK